MARKRRRRRRIRRYDAVQPVPQRDPVRREALAVLDVIEWALQKLRELLAQ